MKLSCACAKEPKNGVAGLSVDGVREEYVRAGDTSGPSLTSAVSARVGYEHYWDRRVDVS